MRKNYKAVKSCNLVALLEEAERLYPEGWDLVGVLHGTHYG